MCRRETKEHGLVLGLGRLGGWWDLVSLKVFSSLDDSMNHSLWKKQYTLCNCMKTLIYTNKMKRFKCFVLLVFFLIKF